MDNGLRKPTLSAMQSLVAPAVAAASKISRMSSMAVLAPSLRMKSTVAPCFLAYSMLSTVLVRTCSLVVCVRYCRLSSLNAVSMEICFTPHSRHASILLFDGCAVAVSLVFWKVSFTMRLMVRLSSSENAGKPTFMTAIPVSSMNLASFSCST